LGSPSCKLYAGTTGYPPPKPHHFLNLYFVQVFSAFKMSEQAFSQNEQELYNSLVMELNMAGCEAQLNGMSLQSGRRSSIGSASDSSCGSYMSNEEFEDFLFAVLQEELAAQAAAAVQQH